MMPLLRQNDVILTYLRQNDVVWRNYVKMTSFWRYNDVIITLCVQWETAERVYIF